MSHKATNWLSSLTAEQLTNSEFRVLFHLCDCHNPSAGCFPTQAYLIRVCGVSNGTLNNALNGLEAKGHIRRHRERDGKTCRQRPTRYILGFEGEAAKAPTPETGDGASAMASGSGSRSSRLQSTGDGRRAKPSPRSGAGRRTKPTPETGDGRRQIPSPRSGDGAVSNLRGEPSPVSRGSRLQPTGERTCKEPVINPGGVPERSQNPLVAADAERAVERFRQGRDDALAEVKPWVRNHILAANLLTPDERRRAGMI